MFIIKGKYGQAYIMIDTVEDGCIKQVYGMLNHKAFANHVAIMPDCHSGKGSVVGFTMPMGDMIVPNVVGVDIGCGMLSMNVGKIGIDHENVDKKIREIVPFGMKFFNRSDEQYHKNLLVCKQILDKYYDNNEILENMTTRLGTLGGG